MSDRTDPPNTAGSPSTGSTATGSIATGPTATGPTAAGPNEAELDTVTRPAPGRDHGRMSRLISAGAVMAAGTALSRVMGFFRLVLLAYLFGNGTRQAEMFTIANQLPNSMYILLAGGVLNTVLVPQLVRAIRTDADQGEAYTNRIMTLGLIALGSITVLLTALVPAIIHLYSAGSWREPALSAQYQSMVMLGFYCMPQVFFYGVHVLAGQVLNARDKFGPMMWAPIANNVISILVLTLFLIVFGHDDNTGRAFTSGEELLLGLGATVGIAAQAAVLVPFLKRVGYRFRPRFDFRHTGLGKTVHLAKWTLGFVLVTQIALVVVTRLASGATVGGAGAGITAYTYAYAVWILPHSLITVSLATAMLPSASRHAAEGNHAEVAAETMRTIRLAVTALLPAAVAFLVLGVPIAQLLFGFGEGADDAVYTGSALMALAVGLVPFTVQYICLRAFYALEDTRSTFFLQCLIAAANVAIGIVAVLTFDDPALVATGLGLAYSLAYAIGVLVSFQRLKKHLPDLHGDSLVRHCIRLILAVTPAGVVAWLVVWLFTGLSDSRLVLAVGLVLAAVAALLLFLIVARMLRVREVSEILAVVRRRRSGTSGPQQSDEEVTIGDSRSGNGTARGTIETEPVVEPDPQLPVGPQEPTEASPELPTEDAEGMAQAALTRTGDDRTAGAADDGPDTEPMERIAPRAASLPAGTVLASRYRLEELIAESVPTVTWRATDLVLSRSVLVHLLAPDADNEATLLSAARKASVATDSRFLRVLDAVHSTDPGLGSYIVCEYATGQSLEMVLSHGSLSGLEAAWVVREVADALAGVHAVGLHHQRINPDTVIITPTGNIKIVGLLIESSLRPARAGVVHGADSPEMVDVTDLGRLLYAALVCRWPGGPGFGLPDAPVVGRHWMTPRQVKAGVSPSLDNVCDQILGDPPRHRMPRLTSAGAVVTALTKVLGPADASGDLERRLRQPVPRIGAKPGDPVPVSALLDQPPSLITRPASPTPASRPAAQADPPPVGARTGQTTLTRPVRPVDTSKSRRWIGVLLILTVLLVTAGVISAVALMGRVAPQGRAIVDPPASTEPSPTPSAPLSLTIVGARDFDPEADPPSENPGEVGLAYDGDPKTRWRTVSYFSADLGNLKRGVGLVVDLGSPQPVRGVEVALSGRGTDVELRIPKTNPTGITSPPMRSDRQWRRVATDNNARANATLTPKSAATTRFVLVYLTSLPEEGDGFRGGIYEISVRR